MKSVVVTFCKPDESVRGMMDGGMFVNPYHSTHQLSET